MFKLFKRTVNNPVMITKQESYFKGKTVKDVVDEIHKTFYTEVDKLLSEAKKINSLDTIRHDLIDKGERLKTLGFINTKEVKESELENARFNELKLDNEAKKNLIDAINYFSLKYPNYRFITEKSVEKICEKYNLFFGCIEYYTGTVPDKNLNHIENFRISEDDECYVRELISYSKRYHIQSSVAKRYQSYKDFKLRQELENDTDFINRRLKLIENDLDEINMKCPLEIVAPMKDFNIKDLKINGFKIDGFNISKIEIPDPIVLKPVYFNDQKHYLIVTAWGIESGDELVVNANHN